MGTPLTATTTNGDQAMTSINYEASNASCKRLFDEIFTHAPKSEARRIAIVQYQNANTLRAQLKREARGN